MQSEHCSCIECKHQQLNYHYIICITLFQMQSYEDCEESAFAVFSSAESFSANETCPNEASLTTGDTGFRWVMHTSSERKELLCFRILSSVVDSTLIPVIHASKYKQDNYGLKKIGLYTLPINSIDVNCICTYIYSTVQYGPCAECVFYTLSKHMNIPAPQVHCCCPGLGGKMWDVP